MHVWPGIPAGRVLTRPGTILAGASSFRITVKGRGGHGAMPHLTADPIVAAANIITSLQVLVSRETSPLDSAVVSITEILAGSSTNIIPDGATMRGTIRTLTDEAHGKLKTRVEEVSFFCVVGCVCTRVSTTGVTAQVVKGQAAVFGCDANVDWLQGKQPYYPPTVNNPDTTSFAMRTIDKYVLRVVEYVLCIYDVSFITNNPQPYRLFGEGVAGEVDPTMGGEDFSFITRKVPSCMVFLGLHNESAGSVHGLHTPRCVQHTWVTSDAQRCVLPMRCLHRFTFDESQLHRGAALHAAFAADFLSEHSTKKDEL